MKIKKIEDFLNVAQPQRLSGWVAVWGFDGDETTTNIIGGSVGTYDPMQYDSVWPYLFATKEDAETYVQLLGAEEALAVPISTLMVDRQRTRELNAPAVRSPDGTSQF